MFGDAAYSLEWRSAIRVGYTLITRSDRYCVIGIDRYRLNEAMKSQNESNICSQIYRGIRWTVFTTNFLLFFRDLLEADKCPKRYRHYNV